MQNELFKKGRSHSYNRQMKGALCLLCTWRFLSVSESLWTALLSEEKNSLFIDFEANVIVLRCVAERKQSKHFWCLHICGNRLAIQLITLCTFLFHSTCIYTIKFLQTNNWLELKFPIFFTIFWLLTYFSVLWTAVAQLVVWVHFTLWSLPW